jgi:hypothetical protein
VEEAQVVLFYVHGELLLHKGLPAGGLVVNCRLSSMQLQYSQAVTGIHACCSTLPEHSAAIHLPHDVHQLLSKQHHTVVLYCQM